MHSIGRLIVPCACLLSALLAGCSAPGPSATTYGVRRLATDAGSAMSAAEAALVDAGYHIERRDDAAGVVTTFPVYSESRGAADGGHRRLVSPSRLRRIGEVRVERDATGVSAYCRIVVQEQVSEAYRWREGDLRSDESPSATPIDRDAGSTRGQNTVWKTIRRDKAQERRVLDALVERTDAINPPTEPETQP